MRTGLVNYKFLSRKSISHNTSTTTKINQSLRKQKTEQNAKKKVIIFAVASVTLRPREVRGVQNYEPLQYFIPNSCRNFSFFLWAHAVGGGSAASRGQRRVWALRVMQAVVSSVLLLLL